ncbi:MAG: polyribonucleotide nucleotidyltransferase [Pseudomonadota bacterium]|nr:polyribonucleotide nucleotidyltransferase [Pseudomonadota bacterium]
MKNYIKKEIPMGSKTLVLETGKIARQATASVVASMGGTVVMCAVVTKQSAEGRDFFPLSVHYMEKTYSAGKIPGGYFKREGKPTEIETLTSRLIDRPLRPLFPDFFRDEVQVNCMLLSLDKENPPDVVALMAASAAMSIADVPFRGPMAAARVGFINDEYVLNPSFEELKNSDLDMVVAGSESAVLMVESDANELSEDLMIGAILYGHQEMKPVIKAIHDFSNEVLPERTEFTNPSEEDDKKIFAEVKEKTAKGLEDAFTTIDKKERGEKINAVKLDLLEGLDEELHASYLKQFKEVEKEIVRENILGHQRRIDGRSLTEVRNIEIETNFLPSVHGSALFTRGETQAIVTATLGSGRDVQTVDALAGEVKDNFMLHYNFPSYSVGELGFPMGPKRREIGHGALAKRSLQFAVPSLEEFPYAIRVVSEITESNGSSSMASVCGGSLALMAAGVPVKENIAGVAMGLVKDGDRYEVLTDILGDEDHLGDMDFKVAGTKSGVSGLQMDIKIEGINEEILEKALLQAKDARMHILGEMDKVLSSPKELTGLAPYFCKFKVHKDKVKVVIGKGGSTIKGLQEEFGVTIELQDSGEVNVFGENKEVAEAAKAQIELLCAEPEEGKIYEGVVAKVVEFGAFVTFMPGKDGLLHISQFKQDFEHLTDVVNEGDKIKVRLAEIGRQGRLKLEFAED